MATIHFRRYTTRHNIEVLTTSSIAPTIHAIWIPQCKLKANGEKALTEYLSRQYLFAPIWRHVLNITEVSATHVTHRQEQFFFQGFSPVFFPDCSVLSTNDLNTDCCVCHKEKHESVLPLFSLSRRTTPSCATTATAFSTGVVSRRPSHPFLLSLLALLFILGRVDLSQLPAVPTRPRSRSQTLRVSCVVRERDHLSAVRIRPAGAAERNAAVGAPASRGHAEHAPDRAVESGECWRREV